jgi:AAA15 family ATPase/GTPase
MLIEFSVTNYRSYRERQTLSLSATSSKELPDNICKSGLKEMPALLRTVALYGPNAGGKTNLIRAVLLMQQAIVQSAATGQVGVKLNIQPFAFSAKTASAPSEFEIHFIHRGVRYQYMFAATRTEIVRESLTAYPKGRPQLWFDRTTKRRAGKTKWTFGKKLTGTPKIWRDATRPNALFLSTAVQLNSTQLKPVFDWFQEYLICVIPSVGIELNPYLTYERFLSGVEGKEAVLQFLGAADLRMKDLDVKREPFNLDLQQPAAPTSRGHVIVTAPGRLESFSAQAFHVAHDTKGLIALPMSDESQGTQKLFNSAGGFLKVLRNGSTLLIDEIENSLHPKIVRFVIEQFQNPEVNKSCAQLIFSTHDTSVLTNDLLRRDQIWFADRTRYENTKLYSLSDFKARKEEPYAKNYLRGRYGALPIVGELSIDGH